MGPSSVLIIILPPSYLCSLFKWLHLGPKIVIRRIIVGLAVAKGYINTVGGLRARTRHRRGLHKTTRHGPLCDDMAKHIPCVYRAALSFSLSLLPVHFIKYTGNYHRGILHAGILYFTCHIFNTSRNTSYPPPSLWPYVRPRSCMT